MSTGRIPSQFAHGGDQLSIPATDPNGYVNWNDGYTPDYERKIGTDANAKAMERAKHNYLFALITENLKQWQDQAFPDWRGVAVGTQDQAYSINAVVRYTVNNNMYRATQAVPSGIAPTNTTYWELIPTISWITSISPMPSGGGDPTAEVVSATGTDVNNYLSGTWEFTPTSAAGTSNLPTSSPGVLQSKAWTISGTPYRVQRWTSVDGTEWNRSLNNTTWSTWSRSTHQSDVAATGLFGAVTITDLNAATNTGFYQFTSSATNKPWSTSSGGVVLVTSNNSATPAGIQISVQSTTSTTGLTLWTRYFNGSTYTAWQTTPLVSSIPMPAGGASGGAEILTASVDFNTISTGTYEMTAAAAAGSPNSPTSKACMIEVKVWNDGASKSTQRVVDTSGLVFVRSYSTSWSAWATVYTTGNKPTASDVGALSLGGGVVTGPTTFSGGFTSSNGTSITGGMSLSGDLNQTAGQHKITSAPAVSGAVAQVFHDGNGTVGTSIAIRAMREASTSNIVWEKINQGKISYSQGTTGATNSDTAYIDVVNGNIWAANALMCAGGASIGGNATAGAVISNTGFQSNYAAAASANWSLLAIPNAAVGSRAYINWNGGVNILSFYKGGTTDNTSAVTVHGGLTVAAGISVAGGLFATTGDMKTTAGDLYIQNSGEGGQINLQETTSGKMGYLDMVAASNCMRIFHSMSGTMRVWNFNGDGSFSSPGNITAYGVLGTSGTSDGTVATFVNSATNKSANINLITASNTFSIAHAMSGTPRGWNFNGDGSFVSPGSVIASGAGSSVLGTSNTSDGNVASFVNTTTNKSAQLALISASNTFQIAHSMGGTAYSWSFNGDGSFSCPGNAYVGKWLQQLDKSSCVQFYGISTDQGGSWSNWSVGTTSAFVGVENNGVITRYSQDTMMAWVRGYTTRYNVSKAGFGTYPAAFTIDTGGSHLVALVYTYQSASGFQVVFDPFLAAAVGRLRIQNFGGQNADQNYTYGWTVTQSGNVFTLTPFQDSASRSLQANQAFVIG